MFVRNKSTLLDSPLIVRGFYTDENMPVLEFIFNDIRIVNDLGNKMEVWKIPFSNVDGCIRVLPATDIYSRGVFEATNTYNKACYYGIRFEDAIEVGLQRNFNNQKFSDFYHTQIIDNYYNELHRPPYPKISSDFDEIYFSKRQLNIHQTAIADQAQDSLSNKIHNSILCLSRLEIFSDVTSHIVAFLFALELQDNVFLKHQKSAGDFSIFSKSFRFQVPSFNLKELNERYKPSFALKNTYR